MDEYRMVDGKDVTDFLSAFTGVVSRLFRYIIVTIRQYLLAAIALFLLILSAGSFLWYNSPASYESEMVCEFNKLSKKTYGEMVQKLDALARSHSYDALAVSLQIPVSVARDILSIDGRNSEGSLLAEDATAVQGPMYFKVSATSGGVFNTMQEALLNYLNNGSPLSIRIGEMEMEKLNTHLDLVKKDLVQVDSILSESRALLTRQGSTPDTSLKISVIPALLAYKKQLEGEFLASDRAKKDINPTVKLVYGFAQPHPAISTRHKILMRTLLLALLLPSVSVIAFRLLKEMPNPKAP